MKEFVYILSKYIIILATLADIVAFGAFVYSRNTYYREQFNKMIPVMIVASVVLVFGIILRKCLKASEE